MTTDSSAPTDSTASSETLDWLEPAPDLVHRMEQRMEQMPWTQGMDERVEMIQWWAERGEPAYSRLLELAADPRPGVADLAFGALAASRDSRLVEPLRSIPWPAEDDLDARYSRARAHLRLGDWSHVGVLIDGLEDERFFARAYCFKILKESTRQELGFRPDAPEEERQASVERWREWASGHASDPMRAADTSPEVSEGR